MQFFQHFTKENIMTAQQTHPHSQAKLPPYFQPHPENAAGIVTLDQAMFMIENNMLSLEGAYYLLPPHAWPMLPKPVEVQRKQQPKRWKWLEFLR
jgi:hypothetical protein